MSLSPVTKIEHGSLSPTVSIVGEPFNAKFTHFQRLFCFFAIQNEITL